MLMAYHAIPFGMNRTRNLVADIGNEYYVTPYYPLCKGEICQGEGPNGFGKAPPVQAGCRRRIRPPGGQRPSTLETLPVMP